MEDSGATQHRILTAREAGYVGCRMCGRANPVGSTVCARCGTTLPTRGRAGLQPVWAWLIAGLIAYIPANIWPMLRTSVFGRTQESTIVGGVIELVEYGSYGVAFVVFVASVMIPISKFIAIAYLAITLEGRTRLSNHDRMKLYEVVEFIGRWSMIDVFVVAILTALVQLDFAVAINPGIAAASFALSVAFTMLAAQSFDPRLIWDAAQNTGQADKASEKNTSR
ncbi:MAG: paraquat-inducible protein A [Pseudomonadota bacterium]